MNANDPDVAVLAATVFLYPMTAAVGRFINETQICACVQRARAGRIDTETEHIRIEQSVVHRLPGRAAIGRDMYPAQRMRVQYTGVGRVRYNAEHIEIGEVAVDGLP